MPPRISRDQRIYDAALHEAAHALAFRQGGLPVYAIRVHGPEDARCAGSVLIDELDVETEDEHEAALLGALTGAMASVRHLVLYCGWDPDEAMVKADEWSATDQESFASMAGAWPDEDDFDAAAAWVEEYWDDIVVLAEQLLDAGGVVTAESVL